MMVKAAARAIGLDPRSVWTHTLRKSFRKVLNATPDLDEDTKEALMGHSLPGSRGNYFDVHDIDEIAVVWVMSMLLETTALILKLNSTLRAGRPFSTRVYKERATKGYSDGRPYTAEGRLAEDPS